MIKNEYIHKVLSIEAIRIAADCLMISKTCCMLVGFNSINAYASVNHLHLHGYYLNFIPNSKTKYPFAAQNIQV